MKKRDIIKELQSDPRIYAQCPDTGESFPLKKALMFYIDEPIPDKVQEYLDDKKKDIKDRQRALITARKKTRERVGKATTSINIGKDRFGVSPPLSTLIINESTNNVFSDYGPYLDQDRRRGLYFPKFSAVRD